MMPQNYRPGLDVVRLAALLPVLCYHYCIEAARLGFAVPTALMVRCSCTARSCTATTPIFRAGV